MARAHFAQVARSPGQERKFPVGPVGARKPGYDRPEIDALPTSVTESFCGVGNPLGLGTIHPGQIVLDLGSGAGLDSLLAARRVGPTGKVVGVDLCPAMVEKAQRNASLLGLHNVEFVQAEMEQLPLPDASVDVVIPRRSPLFTATSASGQTRLWLPPRPDRSVPAAFAARRRRRERGGSHSFARRRVTLDDWTR